MVISEREVTLYVVSGHRYERASRAESAKWRARRSYVDAVMRMIVARREHWEKVFNGRKDPW